MRWLAPVVLAAAGCGRYDFAPIERAGDAETGDGAFDAPTNPIPDGADPLHDEDGDGIPDGVDNCPWIAAAQADADGDGIGDACDPAPGVQNHLVLFEAFGGTSLPAGWTPSGAGTWTVMNDELYEQDQDLNANVLVLPTTYAPPDALVAGVTIDVGSTASTNYTLSLVDTLDLGTLDSEKCGMVTNAAGLAIGHEMAGNTVEANTLPWADAMIVGDDYRLTMWHASGNVVCSGLNVTTAGSLQVTNAQYRTTGQLGLRVRNLAVHFHWFALID